MLSQLLTLQTAHTALPALAEGQKMLADSDEVNALPLPSEAKAQASPEGSFEAAFALSGKRLPQVVPPADTPDPQSPDQSVETETHSADTPDHAAIEPEQNRPTAPAFKATVLSEGGADHGHDNAAWPIKAEAVNAKSSNAGPNAPTAPTIAAASTVSPPAQNARQPHEANTALPLQTAQAAPAMELRSSSGPHQEQPQGAVPAAAGPELVHQKLAFPKLPTVQPQPQLTSQPLAGASQKPIETGKLTAPISVSPPEQARQTAVDLPVVRAAASLHPHSDTSASPAPMSERMSPVATGAMPAPAAGDGVATHVASPATTPITTPATKPSVQSMAAPELSQPHVHQHAQPPQQTASPPTFAPPIAQPVLAAAARGTPHTVNKAAPLTLPKASPLEQVLSENQPHERALPSLLAAASATGQMTGQTTQTAQTLQTTQTAQAPLVVLARQALEAISHSTQNQIEIQLNPRELGKLKLAMVPAEGQVTVHVTAERPEVLDSLRRNIDVLSEELRAAGFGEASFEFSQEQSRGDAEAQPDNDEASGSSGSRQPSAAPDALESNIQTRRWQLPDARLDIRL